MASTGVGNTALGAAVCRLIEQYQPEEIRLFDDPVVKDLVGAPLRILFQFAGMRSFTVNQTDAITPGIYGVQVCRARYLDDAVQDALSKGTGQLVILGAGLDTRPYRLPGIERARVYEVDLPAVQADKKKKIAQHFGGLPGHVTYIPIDFDTQSLESVLAGTSFNRSIPTVFIWEGVTQYISEEAVRRTLAYVGTCAPGSSIVFTYVLKSIIERRSNIPNADKMMDTVAKQSPWVFGLEPSEMQAYLQPFHLALLADVGNADYQEKYLKPLGRTMTVFEGERIVHAAIA